MRVFIGCSAKDAVPAKYKELASNVSTMLAQRGDKLIFGGTETGMMGKCYFTFRYEGSRVKAIADITDAETVDAMDLDASEITLNTFKRTEAIFESSEIILLLPGGIGTYSEFLAMLDEKRTKGYDKPIILFNFDKFYTPLLNFFTKAYEENMISKRDLKMFDVVSDVKSLELYLNNLERK